MLVYSRKWMFWIGSICLVLFQIQASEIQWIKITGQPTCQSLEDSAKYDEGDDYDDELEMEDEDEEEKERYRLIESITQKVKQEKPELYKQIEAIYESEDEESHLHFDNVAYELYYSFERHGQQGFDLECSIIERNMQMDKLVVKYHSLKDKKEKQKTSEMLKMNLSHLFDLKVKRRELQISTMETELKDLRESIKNARSNKDKQVKEYLNKLTSRTSNPFDW